MNTKKISGCVLLIALMSASAGCQKQQPTTTAEVPPPPPSEPVPTPDRSTGVIRPGTYRVCSAGFSGSHGSLRGDHLPHGSGVHIGALAPPFPTRVCLGEKPCPANPRDPDYEGVQLWMFGNERELATIHAFEHTHVDTGTHERELHLITITNDAQEAEEAKERKRQGVADESCDKENILTVKVCTLSVDEANPDEIWDCVGLPHGGHAHIQD